MFSPAFIQFSTTNKKLTQAERASEYRKRAHNPYGNGKRARQILEMLSETPGQWVLVRDICRTMPDSDQADVRKSCRILRGHKEVEHKRTKGEDFNGRPCWLSSLRVLEPVKLPRPSCIEKNHAGLTELQARMMAEVAEEWERAVDVAKRAGKNIAPGVARLARRMEARGLVELELRREHTGYKKFHTKTLFIRLPRD